MHLNYTSNTAHLLLFSSGNGELLSRFLILCCINSRFLTGTMITEMIMTELERFFHLILLRLQKNNKRKEKNEKFPSVHLRLSHPYGNIYFSSKLSK